MRLGPRLIVLAGLALGIASSARAQNYSDVYVDPILGSMPGAGYGGWLSNGKGYGFDGPQGRGYWVGMQSLLPGDSTNGPSAYYSPIYASVAASSYSRNYYEPVNLGGRVVPVPRSISPEVVFGRGTPGSVYGARTQPFTAYGPPGYSRRGPLRRLFGRR